MARKIKIPVRDLKVGMYVCGFEQKWLDTPLLRHRFPVRSQADIDRLRSFCRYVYIRADPKPAINQISDRKSVDDNPAPPHVVSAKHSNSGRSTPSHPFAAELESARPIYDRTRTVLDNVLDDARLGRSIDTDKTRHVVREMVASVIRNPDALICLTRLKEKDHYTSLHSVNVCIFSLAFGRHIGLPKDSMYELGVGALLHDIGKMQVPSHILNKPRKLSADEFKVMKRHPIYGRDILTDIGGISEAAISIAHLHHERHDGSGYPNGLRGREITLFPRMVSIVDFYDAVTSQRVYNEPRPAAEAIRSLYCGRDKIFDTRMVDKFIQCVGIYPVGTLLALSTSEIAVVVAINQAARTRPIIRVVLDPDGKKYDTPRTVDLAHQRVDANGQALEVKMVLNPSDYTIDIPSICAYSS